jgi:hypothetical protein
MDNPSHILSEDEKKDLYRKVCEALSEASIEPWRPGLRETLRELADNLPSPSDNPDGPEQMWSLNADGTLNIEEGKDVDINSLNRMMEPPPPEST